MTDSPSVIETNVNKQTLSNIVKQGQTEKTRRNERKGTNKVSDVEAFTVDEHG